MLRNVKWIYWSKLSEIDVGVPNQKSKIVDKFRRKTRLM